jgi:cell division protein FtsZ
MAAENAIQNPLLDEVSLKGAKAVLVNITGGLDMTLLEVDEAANAIAGQVDPEANIIFGAAFDPNLKGMVRVSVVATGMDGASIAAIEPQHHRRAEPASAQGMDEAEASNSAPEPAGAAREPEPAYAAAIGEPKVFEPLRAAGFSIEPETAAAKPEQPAFTFESPAEPGRAPVRLVEPAASEADDEPLFAPRPYGDDRRGKGGWLSLFGRPRHETPAQPTPAPRASPAPTLAAESPEEPPEDNNEDLEIPSFLRRLAN